jgi:hypothetical protein
MSLSGKAVAETRQERREKRQLKEKARMRQHGGGLLRIYRDAILKRFKGLKKR